MASNKVAQYNRLVLIVSILIPIVVGVLFRDRYITDVDFSFLPPVYATINGITAIVLISALFAIKKGNQLLHERLMKLALVLSATFLVMYVLYHISSEATVYGGEGWIKSLYLFILASHIILSMVIVPLVLYTYVRALTGRFELHRKLARITFPIWLYVAITGVIVYLMIAPYYE